MILCPMFKAGMCEKGKRCKNSHDMSKLQEKTSNIDIYNDPREKRGLVPDTILTCKHFIEAVENEMYGFNWLCPNNGEKCNYRHMLPQGYVLNKDKKGDEDDD